MLEVHEFRHCEPMVSSAHIQVRAREVLVVVGFAAPIRLLELHQTLAIHLERRHTVSRYETLGAPLALLLLALEQLVQIVSHSVVRAHLQVHDFGLGEVGVY